MYAFSAAVNYLLVFVALLRLRFTDPETPRTFRVPWNVPINRRGASYQVAHRRYSGHALLVAVLVMVVLTNPIGRTAGPLWVIVGLAFYSYTGSTGNCRFSLRSSGTRRGRADQCL